MMQCKSCMLTLTVVAVVICNSGRKPSFRNFAKLLGKFNPGKPCCQNRDSLPQCERHDHDVMACCLRVAFDGWTADVILFVC